MYERELDEAKRMILPPDSDDEEGEGPPHREPVAGSSSPQPRYIGVTKGPGEWEAWENPAGVLLPLR